MPLSQKDINGLIKLLRSCTLLVKAVQKNGQINIGTGTFIAPGFILTCAHSVTKANKESESIKALWNSKSHNASIHRNIPNRKIDLAVLRVGVTNHPCIYLDQSIELHDDLFTFGYTAEKMDGDAVTAKFEECDGDRLLKLKGGQIERGMSGAALLSLRTGYVVGMLKATRDKYSDLGGRAIPAKVIINKTGDLTDKNLQYHRDNPTWLNICNKRNKKRFPFFKRIQQRREQLSLSIQDLKQRVIDQGGTVSEKTLKTLEKSDPGLRYKLPRTLRKKNTIESVAEALSVPLGYLLSGFSEAELMKSCYRDKIISDRIHLIDDLKEDAIQRAESYRSFIKSLPHDEKALYALPWHSLENQYAFAVIDRMERIYSGSETLILNEPPLIFWDSDDLGSWIANMKLSDEDAREFRILFDEYREYFRGRVKNDEKAYKIALNQNTFVKYLERKPRKNREFIVNDIITFLDYPLFNLILLKPPREGGFIVRENIDTVVEYEIISKYKKIPDSMEGTMTIAVRQTPPYKKPVSYVLTPQSQVRTLIQRDKARIDEEWARALDQYEQDYKEKLGKARGKTLTDEVQKDITRYLLERILNELSILLD